MRNLRCRGPIAFLLLTGIVCAQRTHQTNAEFDGFKGPIKSVNSTVVSGGVQWGQPGGPTLVPPLSCWDCEYAPDGTRIQAGRIVDGGFHGEFIRLVLNANGDVVERYATDSSNGVLITHDIVGPFGKTKETFYANGKVSLVQTYSYDEYGHMSELRTLEPSGKRRASLVINSDKNGETLERASYGKHDHLNWQQTFDPETKIEHFTSFDASGAVTLAWTVDHGKLHSFWEPQDSPSSQAWENFNEKQDENDYDNYSCHPDLRCDLSHVHYEYLNGDERLPVSAEWRDAYGQLEIASYFDYELDSAQNWTRRRVWVWNPTLGVRTLSETDFRVITYWQ
jgi:hypothetical protein